MAGRFREAAVPTHGVIFPSVLSPGTSFEYLNNRLMLPVDASREIEFNSEHREI